MQGTQNTADGVEEGDIIHLGTDISESPFHLFGTTGLGKPLHQVTTSLRGSFSRCLGWDSWKEGNEVEEKMEETRAKSKVADE